MPERRNRRKSCHQCGLEAIDLCESENKHIPSRENLAPCLFCVRNYAKRDAQARIDFHDEMWTVDVDGTPIFDDLTPHAERLLRTLHELTTLGGEQLAESR